MVYNKKTYSDCIGDTVICPHCHIDLLNSNIIVRNVTKEETYYNVEIENGEFGEKEYYKRNTLDEIYEEYLCVECEHNLTDFFEYLYNLNNTSELGLSDDVSYFLASVYKLKEEY